MLGLEQAEYELGRAETRISRGRTGEVHDLELVWKELGAVLGLEISWTRTREVHGQELVWK